MARSKVADHNGDICSSPQEAKRRGKNGRKWLWPGGVEEGWEAKTLGGFPFLFPRPVSLFFRTPLSLRPLKGAKITHTYIYTQK